MDENKPEKIEMESYPKAQIIAFIIGIILLVSVVSFFMPVEHKETVKVTEQQPLGSCLSSLNATLYSQLYIQELFDPQISSTK